MAASTIGTVVVPDEQEISKFIEKVLSALDNSVKTTRKNHYQEMMKRLAKYVNGNHGGLVYDLVNNRDAKQIEMELQARNIDYMLIPSSDGNIGFAVKSTDQFILSEVKESVLSMSVEYTKEYHDIDKFIENVKTSPQMKGLDVPVLTCTNKMTRSLLQQSLYEAGMVTCYSEVTNKICVAPNKVFNTRGDLSDGLLKASFDIARCEMSPQYRKDKGSQIEYDRTTLNRFIQSAKGLQEYSLVGVPQGKKDYTGKQLKIDKNGDILFKADKDSHFKKVLSHEDLENFDNATIYAHLSRYSEEIRDMTIVKTSMLNDFEKGTSSYDNLKANGVVIGGRPVYAKEAEKYSKIGNDIDKLTRELITEVNKEMVKKHNVNLTKPQKLFIMKKNLMVDKLTNMESDAVISFMNKNNELSKEEKQELLQKACKSIDSQFGNSIDDIGISFTKAKDLDSVFNIQQTREEEEERDRKDKQNDTKSADDEPIADKTVE